VGCKCIRTPQALVRHFDRPGPGLSQSVMTHDSLGSASLSGHGSRRRGSPLSNIMRPGHMSRVCPSHTSRAVEYLVDSPHRGANVLPSPPGGADAGHQCRHERPQPRLRHSGLLAPSDSGRPSHATVSGALSLWSRQLPCHNGPCVCCGCRGDGHAQHCHVPVAAVAHVWQPAAAADAPSLQVSAQPLSRVGEAGLS